MLLQTLIDTIFQLVLFSIIPFLWWFFSARKKEKILSWIGLKIPKFSNKSKALIISLLSLAILLASGMYLVFTFEDKSLWANAKFAGLGFSGIIPILIYAIIQTGLCEEILFRGFLNKRISHKFGFVSGNIAQSILFGLLHGVLLFGSVDTLTIIFILIFTSAVGWLMGYLNEKLGNGSIIPSWTIHSLMNIISSFIFLFGIVAV